MTCSRGKKQRSEIKKLAKNATPPRYGVGSRCHRSGEGRETHPQRRASRRTKGMNRTVRKRDKTKSSEKRNHLDIFGSLKMINDVLYDRLQIFGRVIADQPLNLAQVGYTPRHIFKSLFIRFIVGNIANFGWTLRQAFD